MTVGNSRGIPLRALIAAVPAVIQLALRLRYNKRTSSQVTLVASRSQVEGPPHRRKHASSFESPTMLSLIVQTITSRSIPLRNYWTLDFYEFLWTA